MKSRDFVYWLQGFVELGAYTNQGVSPAPDEKQWDCIKQHLRLVFTHEIDPEAGDAKKQEALNQIHSGSSEKLPPNPPPRDDIMYRC